MRPIGEPVDQRLTETRVRKDLAPFGEWQVGGDDDCGPLGAIGDYTASSLNVIGPSGSGQIYKPYEWAPGVKVRLLDKNQTLPVVTVQDSHVGHGLRVNTPATAAAILKA